MFERYAYALKTDIAERLAAIEGLAVEINMAVADKLEAGEIASVPARGVVVEYSFFPNLEVHTYGTMTADGAPVTHRFDIDHLPFDFHYSLHIFAVTREEADAIALALHEAYDRGVQLKIPVPDNESELIPLFVRTEAYGPVFDSYSAGTGADGDPMVIRHFGVLYGSPGVFPKPYFFDERSLAQARMVRTVQLELLCACICYYQQMSELDDAIAFSEANYRYLTTATPGLLNSILIKREVKEVRSTFAMGLTVEQRQFDEAFAELMPYIPDLYQRAMARESADSIYKMLLDWKNVRATRIAQICDAIGIPHHIETTLGEDYQPRTMGSLLLFASMLEADHGTRFSDIYPEYRQYLSDLEQGKKERNEKIVGTLKRAAASGIGIGFSFLPFASSQASEFVTEFVSDALGTKADADDINNELKKQTSLMAEERASRMAPPDVTGGLFKLKELGKKTKHGLEHSEFFKLRNKVGRGFPGFTNKPWR